MTLLRYCLLAMSVLTTLLLHSEVGVPVAAGAFGGMPVFRRHPTITITTEWGRRNNCAQLLTP